MLQIMSGLWGIWIELALSIELIRLNEISRQAKTSSIITNAHKVNKVVIIDTKVAREANNIDFYFLNTTK